jgi:hypothetical protein
VTARSDWVSVATPTIMDGTVIRWNRNETDAEHVRPMASASRNRVELDEDRIPAELRARVTDAATAAHRELAGNRDADVRHYATHTHTLFGPLTPVRST